MPKSKKTVDGTLSPKSNNLWWKWLLSGKKGDFFFFNLNKITNNISKIGINNIRIGKKLKFVDIKVSLTFDELLIKLKVEIL